MPCFHLSTFIPLLTNNIWDNIFFQTNANHSKRWLAFFVLLLVQNPDIFIFNTASLEDKINIIGLMFPNKIEFDGNEYRTNSYNKVLDVIFQETNHLQGKKKEGTEIISVPSASVPRAVFEL